MRRSGVLPGVAAFGFVSSSQAFGDLPVDAARRAGERDQEDHRDHGEHAEQDASRDPLGVRRCRPLGGDEARGEAEREQQRQHQQQQRAELVAGVGPHLDRQLVGAQAGHRERPADERRGTGAGAEQHDRAAQAQRHDGEPEREPEHEREQRAARVGEHQRDLEQRDARPRERVDRRPAGAARAQPQQRHHADRGGQADGVPVVERRAQPRVGLVLGQRAGEHLGQQRPRAHRHACERDPVQDRRPVPGREPRERHRAGERGQVGERAVRLDPGVRRGERPDDRDRRVRREQHQREQRGRAVQPLRARLRQQQRRRAQQRAQTHQRDLDVRRPLQPQPAVGDERGPGQHGGDRHREGAGAPPARGRRGRPRRRRPRRRRVSRAGERGHAGGRTG